MKNRIQKLYLDTSVIGGYYDIEFEKDTKILFDKILLGEFHLVYSSLTEGESLDAPQKVKNFIPELSEDFVTFLELTDEAVQLADAYLKENGPGNCPRSF